MDDTLTAGLAVQKARKVTEQMVPTLIDGVVKARLPDVLDTMLPTAVRESIPAALARIYVAPRDGTDGKAGLDGPMGPQGPAGPSGFNHDDAMALQAAWADLWKAILTPRTRTVIRDAQGRITGLTEG